MELSGFHSCHRMEGSLEPNPEARWHPFRLSASALASACFSIALRAAVGLLELWLVFGNDAFQQALDLIRLQLIRLFRQLEHAAADLLVGQGLANPAHDFRVTGRNNLFAAIADFLEQLFPGAQPGEFD